MLKFGPDQQKGLGGKGQCHSQREGEREKKEKEGEGGLREVGADYCHNAHILYYCIANQPLNLWMTDIIQENIDYLITVENVLKKT